METNIVREFDKKISDETIINIPRKKTYDEIIDELEEENEDLASNMPWNTTEQATELTVTDAAKYSKNHMKVFGNTEQTQYSGINIDNTKLLSNVTSSGVTREILADGGVKITGTATGNSSLSLIPSQIYGLPAGNYTLKVFGVPNDVTINIYYVGNVTGEAVRRFSSDGTKNYNFVVALTEGVTYNFVAYPFLVSGNYTEETIPEYEPYTNGPSPNPDFTQDIHVVTGENTIRVTGKNLCKSFKNGTSTNRYIVSLYVEGNFEAGKKYVISFIDKSVGNKYYRNESFMSAQPVYEITTNGQRQSYYFECKTGDKTSTAYAEGKGFAIFKNSIALSALPQFEDVQVEEVEAYNIPATPYQPHFHQDYQLSLGSLKLCKIGDYRDYIYKDGDNWYKYEAIDNVIITETTARTWYKSSISSDVYSVFQAAGDDFAKYPPSTLNIFCNKFIAKINAGGATIDGEGISTNSRSGASDTTPKPIRIAILKSRLSTDDVNGFKEWLSNNNLTTYIALNTPTSTQITDETLIAQLEAIYNHLVLTKGINHITITASDIKPNVEIEYMQDLSARLNKIDELESRLSLLE